MAGEEATFRIFAKFISVISLDVFSEIWPSFKLCGAEIANEILIILVKMSFLVFLQSRFISTSKKTNIALQRAVSVCFLV